MCRGKELVVLCRAQAILANHLRTSTSGTRAARSCVITASVALLTYAVESCCMKVFILIQDMFCTEHWQALWCKTHLKSRFVAPFRKRGRGVRRVWFTGLSVAAQRQCGASGWRRTAWKWCGWATAAQCN